MKKISSILAVLALALMMVGPALAQGKAPGKPQTVCPVLGGNVDKNLYADYQGPARLFLLQGLR